MEKNPQTSNRGGRWFSRGNPGRGGAGRGFGRATMGNTSNEFKKFSETSGINSRKVILKVDHEGRNNFNTWSERLIELFNADKELSDFALVIKDCAHRNYFSEDTRMISIDPVFFKAKSLIGNLKQHPDNKNYVKKLREILKEMSGEESSDKEAVHIKAVVTAGVEGDAGEDEEVEDTPDKKKSKVPKGKKAVATTGAGASSSSSASVSAPSGSSASETSTVVEEAHELIIEADAFIMHYQHNIDEEQEERKELRKIAMKKTQLYEDRKRPAYQFIMELIGKDAQEQLKRIDDFETRVEDLADPLILYLACVKEFKNRDSTMADSKVIQADRLQQQFYTMRMTKDETLGDFSRRWTNMLRDLKNANMEVEDDAALAERIYQSMDRSRFAEVILFYENMRSVDKSNEFKCANDVWTRFSKSKVLHPDPRAAARGTIVEASVFTAKHRARYADERPPAIKAQDAKKPDKSKVKCFACGELGHYANECPNVKRTCFILRPNCLRNGISTPMLKKGEVILDSACTESITNDIDLLTDVEPVDCESFIEGIGGSYSMITAKGLLKPFGQCYYCKDAGVTCISFRRLKEPEFVRIWDGRNQRFIIKAKSEGFKPIYFELSDESDLYTTNLLERGHCGKVLMSVQDRMAGFTHREVEDAKLAREVMLKLGVPTVAATIQLLTKDANNAPAVPNAAFRNAEEIFGPLLPALRGKSTEPDNVAAKIERIERPLTKVLECFADIIYVKGQAYMLSVFKPGGYVMLSFMGSTVKGIRSQDSIYKKLHRMILGAIAEGFEVRVLHFDGESAIAPVTDRLAGDMPIQLASHKTGHVGDVENLTRLIKSWARGILCTLPYNLCQLLYQWLLAFVVHRVNLFRFKRGVIGYCPTEFFVGRKIDWKRDIRFQFGSYCEATAANRGVALKKDITVSRTDSCICLCPYDVIKTDMCWLLNLKTKRLMTRRKFTVMPITDVIIAELNRWAHSKRSVTNESVIMEEECLTLEDERNVFEELVAPEREALQRPEETIVDTVEVIVPEELEDLVIAEDAVGAAVEADYQGDIEYDAQTEAAREVQAADNSVNEFAMENASCDYDLSPEDSVATAISVVEPKTDDAHSGYNLRSRRALGLKISVRQALAKDEEKAKASIKAEIYQLDDKGVWKPVRWQRLTTTEKLRCLKSFLFLKEKIDRETGELERLKSRLVVLGSMQVRNGTEDVDAPTATWTGILIVSGVAAKENRTVITIDVEGAFLEASREGEPDIHVIIEAAWASLLIEKRPEYADFLRDDGSLVVKLEKALYGLIDSAKLWYLTMATLLTENGFSVNEMDLCIFNKVVNGVQITVVVYVDDIMVTCVDDSVIQDFVHLMERRFAKIVVNTGKVHKYLGAVFDFSVDGEVSVSMKVYEDALIQEAGTVLKKASPASMDLFKTSDTEPILDAAAQACFRSRIMKVAFLAKHVRLELLTAVSFLTTRVGKATQRDFSKLERMYQYLNQERGLPIRLSFDRDSVVRVVASIDASYATHEDGKSHMGTVILFGDGPIYGKSTRQKCVVKSSWEAELLGISEGASQVIWTREFLLCQGYNPEVVVVNDNQATIKSIVRGRPSSDRSRHVKLKHFWLSERIEDGELKLEYCPTENMVADVLTKPLQGEKFQELRAKLLNLK